MIQLDWAAALLMGLAGAGHCLMMCGSLAAALGQQASKQQLLVYNLGRITSYAIAGALVGMALAQVGALSNPALLMLRLLAALLLIAFGCYLAGWWLGLQRLERLGQPLWRRLQPVAQQLRQPKQLHLTFAAGALWGWLPCGLVYSALSWAALSGSAAAGAWSMVMFGLGTLPAMLAFGFLSRSLQQLLQSRGFRHAMAYVMIFYGLWTALIALRQSQFWH